MRIELTVVMAVIFSMLHAVAAAPPQTASESPKGAQAATAPPAAAPAFALAISASNSVFRSGSEVKIKVTLTNACDHEIYVDRSRIPDRGELHHWIEVLDENGKRVAQTRYGREIQGDEKTMPVPRTSNDIAIPLQPGEASITEIDIAKLFDLSKPGTYKVKASRRDEQHEAWAKSNVLTITITP